MRLKDKVVLITASTRGIGLACVKKCAKEGARVYMAARNIERAQEIANTLNDAKCMYNDATKPETFTSMVEDVVKDAGRIDVLVNNFGTSNPGKDLDFANTDPAVFLETVNLNLRSVFMASQAAAKHMAKHGGGSIINISSVSGMMGNPGQANYASSKAGLIGLTKTIAREVASRGITVNAVAPGFIETDMTRSMNEDALNAGVKQVPMGRMGRPEDVANAVRFLASDEASYITGCVLKVDGGMYI